MGKRLCEVTVHFDVPKNKGKHIFNARDELAKAGIRFDTGGSSDGKRLKYDWELDWSLKGGAEVKFKRYKTWRTGQGADSRRGEWKNWYGL